MRSLEDFARISATHRYHRSRTKGSWVLLDRAWARQLGIPRTSGGYHTGKLQLARTFRSLGEQLGCREWMVDPELTNVRLVARYLDSRSLRAEFRDVKGTMRVASVPEESRVDLTVGAAIVTAPENAEQHHGSASFMNPDVHPQLELRTRRLEQADGSGLKLAGDLTIKGVTRPVILEVKAFGRAPDPSGEPQTAFEASGYIDREEFPLDWNRGPKDGRNPIDRLVSLEIEARARPRDTLGAGVE